MKKFASLRSMSSLSLLNDKLYSVYIAKQLVPRCKAFDNFYPELRELYIRRYGYSILTEEELLELGMFLHHKKVLDVGSGTGWLSFNLKKIGVRDLQSLDNGSVIYDNVFKRDFQCDLSSFDDITSYDVIILSMPDRSCESRDISLETVTSMIPGQILLYLGETCGGCTASIGFFNNVRNKFQRIREDLSTELNKVHVNWFGINERWVVLAR